MKKTMKTMKIDKEGFIDWYYSGWDHGSLCKLQSEIIHELKISKEGKYEISLKSIIKKIDDLPSDLILNAKELGLDGNDDELEIDANDDVAKKYNIEFV